MKKIFTAFGSYGQNEAGGGEIIEKGKKFNWNDFGFALGAFAGANGLGLMGLSIAKVEGLKSMLASALPSAGAGILAYYLRKVCPSKIEPTPQIRPTRIPATMLPRQQQSELIGYGLISRREMIKISDPFVSDIKIVLIRMGYLSEDNTSPETDDEFHRAVAEFQRDNGLTPTGWVDMETAGALANASVAVTPEGEEPPAITTVTEAGIGEEVHNPEKKKSRWAWYLAGFGVAGIVVGGVIIGLSAKKKP